MYICENRLSCPRKAKSVLASTLCWSAEPLKVAIKVKMISAACSLHISICNISAVYRVLYQSILNAKLTGRKNLGRKRCTSNRDDCKLENTVKQS